MAELVEVKTIGEVERIVLASGEWDGTSPVEYSNDGVTWSETWSPTDDVKRPEFARVTVHRKGVTMPTRVTIRWDEQFPEASEEWANMWLRSPMRHFGRTARMVAYRQAFRDLLGDIVIEDEAVPEQRAAEAAPAPRDWEAEIVAADKPDVLDDIVKAARKARVFTPDAAGTALDRAAKARRRELAAAELAPEARIMPTPEPPKQAKAEPKRTAPTPADIAHAIANLPKPEQSRGKGGRRPQRQKPRGSHA